MTFAISSPVTGGAQTGLTSPTYTVVADQAPDVNGRQFYVSALGGTQTGVTAHSATNPFTLTMWKPKAARALGTPNPTTGIISSVPTNTYKVMTRKGVTPALGQPTKVMPITTEIPVPAGVDSYDVANLRAALSAHIGVLTQLSAEIGNSVVTNSL